MKWGVSAFNPRVQQASSQTLRMRTRRGQVTLIQTPFKACNKLHAAFTTNFQWKLLALKIRAQFFLILLLIIGKKLWTFSCAIRHFKFKQMGYGMKHNVAISSF